MRKNNKWLVIFLVFMLILPSFLVNADPSHNESSENLENETSPGEMAYKDEVVYANLRASGEVDEIYVVNILEVTKAGLVVDQGFYSNVKNLTDLSEIQLDNENVLIDAPRGKFYYQGNMEDPLELPWNISISYHLNGKKMNPEELAGQDGHFEIKIETTANTEIDPIFYENYLLQFSLALNSEKFSNIEAPDGMIANAGKNQQVTFTVMPEKDGEFFVEADVVDLEFNGIDITAVPSTMSIETPDTNEMTEDMQSLTDGISDLNDGIKELSSGVTELNDGVLKLLDGSLQFRDGIEELSQSSSQIMEASSNIDQALETMTNSLPDHLGEMDFSGLTELSDGLSEIANGLNETASGLTSLRNNFNSAHEALDDAISNIPDHVITEEDFQSLYMSNADREVIDQLIETYMAAQGVKGTYDHTKEAFDAVDAILLDVNAALTNMENSLNGMAQELSTSLDGLDQLSALSELKEGLSELSSNYGEFHSGLGEYTNGVDELANSYSDLHVGIDELSHGTTELEDGVKELQDGSEQLHDSTSDLPEQLQEEIDRMVSDYDKSDVDVISYASSNHDRINSVQFVIKTESIKIEEEETEEEIVDEEKGFWSRFWDLFF